MYIPFLCLMKDQHLHGWQLTRKDCDLIWACHPSEPSFGMLSSANGHRGQACGSVTDASVVHAPCDHVYHATCLGHWANLSLGRIPKLWKMDGNGKLGSTAVYCTVGQKERVIFKSCADVISHQDPSNNLPFSILFRTTQFMIEWPWMTYMITWLWLLRVDSSAPRLLAKLLHPYGPLSTTRKKSEARAAAEDSTQSVRSQRDAVAREVAPWQPWPSVAAAHVCFFKTSTTITRITRVTRVSICFEHFKGNLWDHQIGNWNRSVAWNIYQIVEWSHFNVGI